MKAMDKNRDKAARRGFTLVELIIVILIVAVLVTLAVSFGLIFRQDARASRTKMAMRFTMNAVESHFSATSTWPFSPPSLTTTPFDPLGGAGPFTVYGYTDRLVRDLERVKGPKDLLAKLPSGTLRPAVVPRDQFDDNADPWGDPPAPPARNITQQRSLTATAIVDGWDRPMLYLSRGSSQGKPILISAGPDGRFGPKYYFYQQWGGATGWRTSRETDQNFGLDDITSDSSGM
ncbi:MAG: type II secretion system protein [Planctomycetes bacterium]|nr:type II secretion system protein [Planctomycetota bacterium]